MAKTTARALYLSWAGTAIDDNFRTFEVAEAQNRADATAGQDNYTSGVNTTKTLTASLTILQESGSAGSVLSAAVGTIGRSGTLLWGVEGSATGSPKGGFVGTLITKDRTNPYDDVVEWTLEWEMDQGTLLFDETSSKWP